MDPVSEDKIICPECGHRIEHNLDAEPTHFIHIYINDDGVEVTKIVSRQYIETGSEDPAVIQTRIDHFNKKMELLNNQAYVDQEIMDDFNSEEEP